MTRRVLRPYVPTRAVRVLRWLVLPGFDGGERTGCPDGKVSPPAMGGGG